MPFPSVEQSAAERATPPIERSNRWNDQDIVIRIGNLLRTGVIASALVIAIGGGMHLYHHGLEKAADRRTFTPAREEFSRPLAIVRAALLGRGRALSGGSRGEERSDALRAAGASDNWAPVLPGEGRGRALIQLGLLLLIATPVLRVAFSIFAFARQRDLLYVLFPLIVLGVLLYGLFSGHIE